MTALAVACLLLCGQPALAQTSPTISGVYPNGAYQFQRASALTFTASSAVGIAPSAIIVRLTGTTLFGQVATTTFTTANGLIVSGSAASWTVSAPLASNMIYTAVLQAVDANEATVSSTVSFDTITPSYTFEAEDFDYNSGRFIDNPQTNAYANLNGVDEIDDHNTGGGNASYRPNPGGLATEPDGDTPRLAYTTGKTDYDVGWNSGGGWGNYTRTFPAGIFNVYLRASNPNSFVTDAAGMWAVTAGRGTANQTLTSLGIFSIPDTGSWQTYTWVPLLDTNGNLVEFTGGQVKTLRVTTDNGSYNANCYLLMPADLSLPVITNVFPNGSSFFQFTNQFSFLAESTAGLATGNITVILDGINVSNLLNFAGSLTTQYVTCPLSLNTNHSAVITVLAKNGLSATLTVSFNDFSPTNYQWEAEDYDYGGGRYFDNPQVDAYAGLGSVTGTDNYQADTTANPFLYRATNGPSTTLANDGQRQQFVGATDYGIGFLGNGSWLNYTRHYPAGTYYVWGRFAGSAASEVGLSQLTSGYATPNQTSNYLGTFNLHSTGGPSTWGWQPLPATDGSLLKVRFDGSPTTLQLVGGPSGAVPEVEANFLMLVPTTPDLFAVLDTLNTSTTNVQIVYSKPVEAASATNIYNYVFTDGLAVTAASLSPDYQTVVLTTAPLVYGSNYSILLNAVRDRMNLPNTITTNTTVTFQALPYTVYDIGNPAELSTVSITTNELTVTAMGAGFGGTSDQGNFSYQTRTGNFDVCVQVAHLGLSDIFAQAGLMAREDLASNARFAASFTTPSINGSSFEWRDPAGNTTTAAGSFPANYPNTWLRLQRVGNTFNGYAGYDGKNWTLLASDSISMSNQVYLGYFVSSYSTNQATTARFGFITTVTNAVIAMPVNPHDAMGPTSRTTPIAFSEIMWKPAPRSDGRNLEFLEIYNSNPWFTDISAYQITCADMNYTFPAGTTIPGGGYLVIAAAPVDLEAVYGITNVMGPYTGSLKHAETLQLLDEQTNVLLTLPYTDVYPWPVATGGTGHSLVLANPTYGEGDPRAWDISDVVGGSPGQMDGFTPSPLRNVLINEILPQSENPAVPQFIELYNHAPTSVDVSGCILTDDPATNKFVLPAGTVIGPAGFVFFTQSQFGFTLNGAGETLYLIKPDGSRVLDAVQFGAQADGVSYGRWPDGANDFYAFTTNTPGTNNSSILVGDVVINELMYDPISGNDDDQYIELYNQGTNTVNLAGWQFTAGVTFTFPKITIAPNAYLVVAKSTTNLFAKYTNLNSANTVGNFGGKLSHNGELVMLSMPETLGTNAILVSEDQVTYGVGGRWGEWSGGGGSSLELIDPHANHRLAANWADSDESQKSSWVDIENTGVLDNGANYDAAIDYAQIGPLDAGECLVDDIEVDRNGSNYVSNGTFESGQGLNNWSLQGCMTRSSLEPGGYQSSYSLHIRSSDRLWTGVNSCQVSLANTNLLPTQLVTLRFKARWLRGWPEALLRLNGNWLEAAGTLPVPTNLGTPGLPNSQYLTNAGPAVYNVTHRPSVPAALQPVVVSARVHDPDGLQTLRLYYRLDPAKAYSFVFMNDNGANGDAVAGDGIFSATIPGQPANQVVAFYIAATDDRGASTRFPALRPNDNEPPREGVVMFGDGNNGGSFSVYHLWITQTNVTRWANLSDLSNEGSDCTFVNGNRVIYNLQGRFAGSPYHQFFDTPNGNLCHYKWEFNDDDKFLGAIDFNKIHQPGNGPGDDASIQREQLANTFLRALGVPWLSKRYAAVYVNGNRRGSLMEDTQVPDGDIIKEHFPNDTGGTLYKMQPWFEMGPFPSGSSIGFDNQSWCTLEPYTTTGGLKKPARYRYNYLIRHTSTSDNDFTNVFSLIDAASSYGTPHYVANMENLANMENWMRVFAANHAAGNWDSFGAQNGQNLYGYIGASGTKYSLLMWDFNIVIGNSGSWGPGQNLLTVDGSDPNLINIYNTPIFLRMYWRALEELVNGPLNIANSGPLLDAKYNVFAANGLNVENPDANIKPWLLQAQASIASQLAAVDASAFTASRLVTTSNNVAYVTGTAPVAVAYVQINGISYPVTWTTLTTWTASVPLHSGANELNVVGVDIHGQPMVTNNSLININYINTLPSPGGQVVFNEIMYDPAVSDAQYVELYNNSTNTAFDLSGWQIPSLSYTFPEGAVINPANYLVLAANNVDFDTAYGSTNAVFDLFNGTLSTSRQNLTLIQPGTAGSSNVTVAEIEYQNVRPWPTNANGTGRSLQLIDSHQDNWRVGNWQTATTYPFATPGLPNRIALSLTPFPPLWINELQADNVTRITNSAGQRTGWLELYNPGTNVVSLKGLYLANNFTNLTQWAFPTNATIKAGQFEVIFADAETNLSATNELHASFILPSGAGSLALSRISNSQTQVLDYVNYSGLATNNSFGSFPDGQSFLRQEFSYTTPGSPNNGNAPQPSFISYAAAGLVYTQNFDSLPDPGAASVNTANPVTIDGVTYSLANPFDFAFPVSLTGNNGGMGNPDLAGWYGLANPTASVGTRFGATDGDQTTGGQLSFGLANNSNRALGLLATSTTGYTAFGAKIVDNTGATLKYINLHFTGELWRQSNIPKTLEFYYLVDPTGSAAFSTQATAYLPRLNVSIPTVSADVGGTAVDGTNPLNQTNLSATNLIISNWAPGTALWLVWEMADATGKAQGLGIDNFSFSATALPIGFSPPALNALPPSGTNFTLSFGTVAGPSYQLEYSDDLASTNWIPLGAAVSGTGNPANLNLSITNQQRFFRITVSP